MSKLLTWGLALAAGLGVAGYEAYEYSADEKAVLAKYDFTEMEMTGFEMCQGAMKKNGAYFDGTSENQGCGCITRQISKQVEPKLRLAAHEIDMADTWYSTRNYDKAHEAEWQGKITSIGESYKLSTKQLQSTLVTMDKIITQCSG